MINDTPVVIVKVDFPLNNDLAISGVARKVILKLYHLQNYSW